MRKKRKILFALLMASVLMVSTGVLVAASSSDCAHIWEEKSWYTGNAKDQATSTCAKEVITQKLCVICFELTDERSYVVSPHQNILINSTCTGRKQIYEYQCTYCGYGSVKTITCPSAPHTGACPSLNG